MDRWQHVQDIFAQALECAPGQRETLLKQVCADDADLRAEVESLLQHHDQGGENFMRPPPPPPAISVLPASSQPGAAGLHEDDPLVGQEIDGYHINSVLAAGGMGTVYLAEQRQPRRLVALKLLRAGIASNSALRRFEYESEILAHLRHPNIAEIYEAGTHLGLPYFVMEYIPDARPITEYADEHGLSARDRLKLFTQVCDAVYHGHQRGIIHRDLKPANILVDTAGRVKVIDFGVARATDADIALTTLRTETGQLIGTLQYMSPEQCDADPHEIDVRSDVYSLGVLLYELLCGRLPYDVTRAAIPAAARVICEHEPPRPSSVTGKKRGAAGFSPHGPDKHEGNRSSERIASVDGSESGRRSAARAKAHGSSDGSDTARVKVRGDLERIILTALEKDRTRRYQSAADLLRDIRHYLNREPIEAKPPTLWTRTLRWMARHPAWATTATCLTIATLVFAATCVSVWWLNSVPHRIVCYDDAGGIVASRSFDERAIEAQLLTRSGRTIHTWNTKTGRVTVAELVERPSEFGGGKLAVIGFSHARELAWGNSLAAFDVSGDLDTPVWIGALREDEPLPDPHDRGYQPREFHMKDVVTVDDIFPGDDHPGLEIVAFHDHGVYSQGVLRVYDQLGRVLYQVWQDGGIGSMYWMAESQLLVCLGCNGTRRWDELGWDGEFTTDHPSVVFALRPEAAGDQLDFIENSVGRNASVPWYACLVPPESYAGRRNNGRPFLSPPQKGPVGLSVGLGLDYSGQNGVARGGISFDLDSEGLEVPGPRILTDSYLKNLEKNPPGHADRLPEPGDLRLVPWPPSPPPK